MRQSFIIGIILLIGTHSRWAQWRLMPRGAYEVPIGVHVADTVIVVLTYQKGVARSRDRGLSWEPSGTGLPNFTLPIFMEQVEKSLFLGADSGLFESTDVGVTWRRSSLPDQFSHNTYAAIEHHGIWYVGGDSGVFRSTDKGASWAQVFQARSVPRNVRSFAYDGDRLFVGTRRAYIHASTDNGETWDSLGTGLPEFTSSISSILVGDGFMLAGLLRTGLFRSVDNGRTWHQVAVSWPGDLAHCKLSAFESNIFMADAETLLRSTDGGITWTDVGTGLSRGRVRTTSVVNDTMFSAVNSVTGNWIWYRPFAELLPSAGIEDAPTAGTGHAFLENGRPNPGATAVTMSYFMAHSGHVSLKVYNTLQQEVACVIDGVQEGGRHQIDIDVRALPSGTYYCRLVTDGIAHTKPMVVVH